MFWPVQLSAFPAGGSPSCHAELRLIDAEGLWLAQVFEIGSDGRMTRLGEPIPVLSEIAEVLDQFPGNTRIDPPTGPNVLVVEDDA